jgi:hypothetical protein
MKPNIVAVSPVQGQKLQLQATCIRAGSRQAVLPPRIRKEQAKVGQRQTKRNPSHALTPAGAGDPYPTPIALASRAGEVI